MPMVHCSDPTGELFAEHRLQFVEELLSHLHGFIGEFVLLNNGVGLLVDLIQTGGEGQPVNERSPHRPLIVQQLKQCRMLLDLLVLVDVQKLLFADQQTLESVLLMLTLLHFQTCAIGKFVLIAVRQAFVR